MGISVPCFLKSLIFSRFEVEFCKWSGFSGVKLVKDAVEVLELKLVAENEAFAEDVEDSVVVLLEIVVVEDLLVAGLPQIPGNCNPFNDSRNLPTQ